MTTAFSSLREHADPTQLSVLNVADADSVRAVLGREPIPSAYLQSDADEQLLISIGYNQGVKISSIRLGSAASLAHAPKKIKVFANEPTLDFDAADQAEEVPRGTAVAVLELTEEQATGKEPIQLRFVRLQSVSSIQIFVESNQGEEDTTRVDTIEVIGAPIATTKMGDLKAVEDDH